MSVERYDMRSPRTDSRARGETYPHGSDIGIRGTGADMAQAFEHEALRHWSGRQVVDDLARRGTLIRCPSPRGVAEEAPGAYKDVSEVVEATQDAGLARKVARLEPLVCVKG